MDVNESLVIHLQGRFQWFNSTDAVPAAHFVRRVLSLLGTNGVSHKSLKVSVMLDVIRWFPLPGSYNTILVIAFNTIDDCYLQNASLILSNAFTTPRGDEKT